MNWYWYVALGLIGLLVVVYLLDQMKIVNVFAPKKSKSLAGFLDQKPKTRKKTKPPGKIDYKTIEKEREINLMKLHDLEKNLINKSAKKGDHRRLSIIKNNPRSGQHSKVQSIKSLETKIKQQNKILDNKPLVEKVKDSIPNIPIINPKDTRTSIIESNKSGVEKSDALNEYWKEQIFKAETKQEINAILKEIELDNERVPPFTNRAFVLIGLAKSRRVAIHRKMKAEKDSKLPVDPNQLPNLYLGDMKLNDVVLVRWTANGYQYEGLAEVSKLNQKTANVRLIENVKPYSAGNRIQINIAHQTKGNAILGLNQELRNRANMINSNKINVELSGTEYKDRREIARFGLKWDSINSSWRGKVNKENIGKLKKFGMLETNTKEYSHDEQISSLIEKEERKLERLEKGIKSRKSKVESLKKTQDFEGEFLSLGEPIKVGHHSEKRHRKLIERHNEREHKIYDLRGEIGEKQHSVNVKRRKIEQLRDKF